MVGLVGGWRSQMVEQEEEKLEKCGGFQSLNGFHLLEDKAEPQMAGDEAETNKYFFDFDFFILKYNHVNDYKRTEVNLS